VSEGKVAVGGESGEQVAGPGQQVEASEQGVQAPASSQGSASYDKWQGQKAERLKTQSEAIVKSIKGKIMSRKDKLESLRAQQKEVEEKRKAAETRARAGEQGALDELRQYNRQLAALADQIADLGDEAVAQLGVIDHFADLVNDPRFRGISRKYIEAEAKSLRAVRATLDKLVAEGTDMSIEAMDKMLEDMSKGKPTIRDKKGSSAKDLFDGDDMKMH
jgi:vacuolar-type H+-ATPase subunit I/STV1